MQLKISAKWQKLFSVPNVLMKNEKNIINLIRSLSYIYVSVNYVITG